jgi:two-component system response regulator DesR
MVRSNESTKVYLADDSAIIRSRVAAVLAEHGMQVVGEDATPQGAIAGILAARPDVVVLDAQLEGGTGMDVLRAVRQARPATPFVLFSIHAEPAYREIYLRQGGCRFLDKAMEFEQLVDAVESLA